MGKLDGKVAIITGGAGGIGAATAELFAQEGARIVIVDRDEGRALAVAEGLRQRGGQATAIRANVADEASIRAMINHALSAYARIDILVNNAGVASVPAPIHATDNNDWRVVLDVCLTSVFLGTKYVIPQMMEQGGGCIINVASVAGVVGAPGLAPYAAAKAGVLELTRTTAAEYSRYNIRCNALAPGWTQTAMLDAYIQQDAETESRLLKAIPQRRFGQPQEIAAAALFLASDDAPFLQGQTIILDGGMTIL